MNHLVSQHEDLRSRLQNDPAAVLTEQFIKYRTRLSRIARFRLRPLVGARIDEDDIFQDAWLAAFQRLPHFLKQDSMSMFVWLRLIVGQTIVDLHRFHLCAEIRAMHKEVAVLDQECLHTTSRCLAAQLIAELESPSQVAMQQETAWQLESAIEAMDPIDREILAMRHFEELTNREIAEALEISEQAASIRYVRAVKRLKQILKV